MGNFRSMLDTATKSQFGSIHLMFDPVENSFGKNMMSSHDLSVVDIAVQ